MSGHSAARKMLRFGVFTLRNMDPLSMTSFGFNSGETIFSEPDITYEIVGGQQSVTIFHRVVVNGTARRMCAALSRKPSHLEANWRRHSGEKAVGGVVHTSIQVIFMKFFRTVSQRQHNSAGSSTSKYHE